MDTTTKWENCVQTLHVCNTQIHKAKTAQVAWVAGRYRQLDGIRLVHGEETMNSLTVRKWLSKGL